MADQESAPDGLSDAEATGGAVDAPVTDRKDTDDSLAVRPAGPQDTDRIASLLAANGLPNEAVYANPEWFLLATVSETVVGIGGVEEHGSHGLLRSVVVPEPHRGHGYGAQLVTALEDRARAGGVETLYLLTTTAPAFFRACGYAETPREDVPAPIQQTGEFSELCPSSATCMEKLLR